MGSYRDAEKKFATAVVHHSGDATVMEAAKNALLAAATGDERNSEKAMAAIQVFDRKQAKAGTTYEGKALGKFKTSIQKSSIGNFFLGCLNPGDAY